MRIYELNIREPAQRMEQPIDYKKMHDLRKSVPNEIGSWQVMKLQKMDEKAYGPTEITDWTSIGMGSDFPLCSTTVRDILTDTCGVTGQWLNVDFPEKQYHLLNLTHVIDALDQERSDRKYFTSSGRLQEITRYAFHPDIVKDEWLFRDKTDKYSIFCTQRFANLAAEKAWTGIYLKPAWDSDHEPFMIWPTKDELKLRPEIYGPDGFYERL